MEGLKPGTQIVYIPTHAEGNENHPDCESGFVTSVRGDIAFCRYWRNGIEPSGYYSELRTTANSEATPLANLIIKKTVPQGMIAGLLNTFEHSDFYYQQFLGEQR